MWHKTFPLLHKSLMECLCTQVRTSIAQSHTKACDSVSRGMHALSPNSQRCRCMLCKHGRHPAVLGTNPLDTVRTEKEERGKWNFMHLVPTTQRRYRHTSLYRLVCPSVRVGTTWGSAAALCTLVSAPAVQHSLLRLVLPVCTSLLPWRQVAGGWWWSWRCLPPHSPQHLVSSEDSLLRTYAHMYCTICSCVYFVYACTCMAEMHVCIYTYIHTYCMCVHGTTCVHAWSAHEHSYNSHKCKMYDCVSTYIQ